MLRVRGLVLPAARPAIDEADAAATATTIATSDLTAKRRPEPAIQTSKTTGGRNRNARLAPQYGLRAARIRTHEGWFWFRPSGPAEASRESVPRKRPSPPWGEGQGEG